MKGIIYDLDGVIVDTAKYHYLGWKKLADELGVPFDEARNEKLKGVGRRESLIALLGRTPEEAKITEWCDRKNAYYLILVATITRADMLPGALDRIQEVKKAGWKQALASSSKNARLILEKLDITSYFDAVVDGNATPKSKPDPALFQIAAQKIGLSPDDVLVVEDAASGVEAAKAGGMRALGLGEAKNLPLADRVVKDLSQVTLADFEALLRAKPAAR